MIGRKVKLTPRMVKYYLDNPDIFFVPGGKLSVTSQVEYDVVMQLCLLSALGEDVTGEIFNRGSGDKVFGVKFKTPFGEDFSYYELERDIEFV